MKRVSVFLTILYINVIIFTSNFLGENMASKNEDILLSSNPSFSTSMQQSDQRLRKFPQRKHQTRARSLVTIHTKIRSKSTSTSRNARKQRKVINTFHLIIAELAFVVFLFRMPLYQRKDLDVQIPLR